MVIDCFSKYLFVEPLKRKTTEAIIEGFRCIFKKTRRRCERLRTDKGGEYNSRKFRAFMKENEIIYSNTQNPETKCSIAERCVKTVKHKIFKYLSYTKAYRYVDVLDDIVKAYNNGYHRTIKMAPSEVNEKNILQVYRNIKDSQKMPQKKRPKLKVGDYVRLSKSKTEFQKSYLPIWTQEVFKVKSIANRNPVVYYVQDLSGEELKGTFYEPELQKINFDEGAARSIEKIIKQRTKAKTLQYLVKWRSYPDKFNSWINADTVSSI